MSDDRQSRAREHRLLRSAAATRRAVALFRAMSNDYLLREQFITDPAQIWSEYVYGTTLPPQRASVINQFVYSVMSNPGLVRWLGEYVTGRATRPSHQEFMLDFGRGVVENEGRHVMYAFTRAAIDNEAIFPFDDSILDILFGGGVVERPVGETARPGTRGGTEGTLGGTGPGTEGTFGGTFGTAGTLGGTAGTFGGTEGTFGGTAGTFGGTEGTFGGTAGTFGGTEGTFGGTAGTLGGTAGTFGGTEGTFGGTAGTLGGTAGTFGGTAGTFGGTAGTFGGTGGTAMTHGTFGQGTGMVTEMSTGTGGTQMSTGTGGTQMSTGTPTPVPTPPTPAPTPTPAPPTPAPTPPTPAPTPPTP
ncbi:hypothetical protein NKI67_24885, partial [Mesorhizobium sp. M0408]